MGYTVQKDERKRSLLFPDLTQTEEKLLLKAEKDGWVDNWENRDGKLSYFLSKKGIKICMKITYEENNVQILTRERAVLANRVKVLLEALRVLDGRVNRKWVQVSAKDLKAKPGVAEWAANYLY